MKENAVLIFTPIDKKYKDADTHFAPPLGLAALENYLFQYGFNVTIIDGSVKYTFDEIKSILLSSKPMFVGQSLQMLSYNNALEIAGIVHSYGGINVFGGHHATQMCDSIIYNQHDLVDYVVVGDGEEAWRHLISGSPVEEIPNIVYWKEQVCHNPCQKVDLTKVPQLDYSRIDLTPYKERLASSDFCGNQYSNYLRIYSHKGCGNRKNGNSCIFCGRSDQGIRFKDYSMYWRDIQHCVNDMKGDYIFDVGDDLLFSAQILKEYVSHKPDSINHYEMGVFGRANRVTEETSSLLRELGVVNVTIGFETGDEEVMKRCNKLNSSPAQNMVAADCLTRNGIDITASYVLGMPGENDRSLYNTLKNAEAVADIIMKNLGHMPSELVANLLEPIPGSPAFKEMQRKFPEKYVLKDRLDLEEMQRDYFYTFFDIHTYSDYHLFRKKLIKTAREMHELVSFSDSQGWLNGEL